MTGIIAAGDHLQRGASIFGSLGVVFEIGVQPVTPFRAHHVQEPRQLVKAEGQHLRDHTAAHEATPLGGRQLFHDEQVPLLVVLLPTCGAHPAEHMSGESWLARRVHYSHVGDVPPCLIQDG
jgi:hypothetical protein